MRILFFGTYDPEYSRNKVLIQGLTANGAQVTQCNSRRHGRLFRAIALILRYWSLHHSYDVMFVAFPGQEMMFMARLLTRKPIVFDAFTSHYEGYVEDRRTVTPASVRARWYAILDRLACRLAMAVLTDTQQHATYFSQRFGVPIGKLHPVLLGTTLTLIPTAVSAEVFTVHFHGSNIPLQGIDTIWAALRRLWNESVRFQMIGPFTVPNELKIHVHHEEHVSFSELASRIAQADVCLGIFGASPKTQRVIPNKVYEALAMSKPVITSDTPAVRELLDDASALLIPAGDADALAQAILRLKDDSALRERIATAGHRALLQHATPAILGRQVLDIMMKLL